MLALGIDLTASSKKGSPYAFLNDEGVLLHMHSFKDHDELYRAIEEHSPTLIAIDAPLSLPSGLCCLEEDCECFPTSGQKGRVAEQQLASMGIGCFFTTKRSIIRNLIYRAMDLRCELIGRGYRVIEVYPYASKLMLFGGDVPAKSNPASLPFLREKLTSLIPGLEPYVEDLNHDRCEALLTAYTGYLHLMDRTASVGQAEEGLITLPKETDGVRPQRRRTPRST